MNRTRNKRTFKDRLTSLRINLESKINKLTFWRTFAYMFIPMLIYLLFVFKFCIIDNHNKVFFSKKGIICSINFPAYISYNDERTFDITLTNTSKDDKKKVFSCLQFNEDIPVVISSARKSLISDFGILKANETKTKTLEFYLSKKMSDDVGFNLKILNKEVILFNETFKIKYIGCWFPFPYMKKVLLAFWGAIFSAFGIIMITLLSEKFKTKLFPGE